MTGGDVDIRVETPLQDDLRALIAELNDAIDAQEPHTPDEFKFRMTAEEMARPDTTTFLVRIDGAAVGCGALRRLDGQLGEVKRMYLRPAARGRGLAARLLQRIEAEALAQGLDELALETGIGFRAARQIYERAGFAPCGAFADYPDSGYAAFYRKTLARRDADQAVSRPFDAARP
ncbi:GNAT family N-acetyltransferase [Aureimonas flava]|uniref:GNAT family N-acetyltransferase n=1 Tax=Aureimonas flava TaxID=2320271 RepID=A0A3A1WP85_9HYPH|nr:GNAT family N-acetyltransferase [Aureimonas flava]RIY03718.1 GNAT family N-acetyltransferase [Aureimonas flava]